MVENKIHPYDYENMDYNNAMGLTPPLHDQAVQRLKEFVEYDEAGVNYLVR